MALGYVCPYFSLREKTLEIGTNNYNFKVSYVMAGLEIATDREIYAKQTPSTEFYVGAQDV